MAMGSSVPPRAYTREILTTAFNWLQSQPDSVRAKATTPDALVGLFMQAQRGGTAAPTLEVEAPKSAQMFMSDLKNLAEGLKEFDDSRATRPVTPPASARAQLGQAPFSPQPLSPAAAKPAGGAMGASARPAAMAAPRAYKTLPLNEIDSAPASVAPASVAPSSGDAEVGETLAAPVSAALNARSLEMLREVQLAMNLTSEVEAMNLMIAVAHKNLKSLLA